jgi:hypothetical protein
MRGYLAAISQMTCRLTKTCDDNPEPGQGLPASIVTSNIRRNISLDPHEELLT